MFIVERAIRPCARVRNTESACIACIVEWTTAFQDGIDGREREVKLRSLCCAMQRETKRRRELVCLVARIPIGNSVYIFHIVNYSKNLLRILENFLGNISFYDYNDENRR